MMTCGEKSRKLIYLERRLKGESTESKITEFGSRFVEKSSSEVDINSRTKVNKKRKSKIEID